MQTSVPSPNLPIKLIPNEVATRDGVFAVSFCFLFSIAPHFPNVPIWVIFVVLFAVGWRSLQNLGKLREVPKWVLIPLVLLGGLAVFAEYWTIVGRDAGLALLVVMTSFKFLESKQHRDMLILVFLCYFLIATHFLYSQSIPTAVMMLVTLIVITATLITLNQRDHSVSIRERLRVSSQLVLLSIPLMLILFVLVPRVPGPLWGLQTEQRSGVTGLSDHMSPGKISNLIRSNEVAFRVEFKDEVPAQSQLYWRGPVMTLYNGYRWSQAPRRTMPSFKMWSTAPPVEYTVTMEPNGEHWLLALEIPTRMVADAVMTEDYQLVRKKRVNELLRYTTESRLVYEVGKEESLDYLRLALEYPDQFNQKTIELGKSLQQRYDNPAEIVNAALQMFSQENYIYTLSPPVLGANPVDEFLFDTRRGFCEHYAGAFTLLMRAAGIPARVVTGYQGGEYNRVGNYLIVRQSDAHAWSEVWLEGRGWLRIDPTAAVSPNRIEQGLDDALADDSSTFRIQNRNPIFGNILYSWDNLQHGWNDWVLNYDQRKQRDFLSRLELGIENWSDMIFAMVIMLVTVTGLYWFAVWYRELPPPPQAYEIQFRKLLKKLSKRGFDKKPSEDTRAFLQRISAEPITQREQIARIVELYNRIKYGGLGTSRPVLNNLRELINSIN